jgi:mannose-6-phosphate isomerase-like protein (cupin superfamily)
VIVFSNEAPVEIHGGEDGSGPLFWKRFVGAPDMHADWESFEYARLPDGGVIGEHVHERTEEIYFVTKGKATMHLDDVPHVVGPGDLILTPLNGKHRAAVDQGDPEWEFIVAEVLPPEILHANSSSDAASVHRPFKIVNLETGDANQFDDVFSGAWSAIAVDSIPAGQQQTITADTAEHALYVLSGHGTATTAQHTFQLREGQGLAIPKGGRVTLAATDPDELKIFRITVTL